jgi:diketogulonate reductase-like aldo/keto reductase
MSNLIDRRTLLQATGASVVAGSVKVAQAAPTTGQTGVATDDLIVRKIPKGEDVLPAIGLGTFITFDLVPGARRDHLLEVTRRFWAAGGRVIDTSPLYGMAEVNVGQFASVLGINDKMFVSNKVWATGEYLADDRQAEDSLRLSRERLWRDKIDLMLCHSLVNVDIVVPLMHAWKKEGRIRFLGVTHYELPYFEALAQWVEKGNLDVVQVHYSIATRQAEERIIPAAADRGMAVAINMPLEKARLHKLVEGRPLPDFAKEFGAETWSAFFLKWVISNPAVTVALPATTNPDHLTENVAAMRGLLVWGFLCQGASRDLVVLCIPFFCSTRAAMRQRETAGTDRSAGAQPPPGRRGRRTGSPRRGGGRPDRRSPSRAAGPGDGMKEAAN